MTQIQIKATCFMKAALSAAICGALAFGCSADQQRDGAQEIEEIVDNLVQAGFPMSDIQIVDGKVYTGRDALVTLQASREMLQADEQTEEQYRTNNLVSHSITRICINPSSSFSSNSALMTGLNEAVANYNALPLTFDFAVGPTTGCHANISITTQSGTGGLAGFPSGGLPFPGPVFIGTSIPAQYGSGPTRHVIEHELGHCIGFRHSDYYNRSISCGGSFNNEGDAGVGAILIPGTPSTAVYNGSVYNSCYNSGSTGTFTSSDVTALTAVYPGCDPRAGTYGETWIDTSADSQYVYHDGWCSVGTNWPAMCWEGTYYHYQYTENYFCSSIGSGGSCYDPDAWWWVTCKSLVDCVYNCNGECVKADC